MKSRTSFAPLSEAPQRVLILMTAVLISPMVLLATSSLLGTVPSQAAPSASSEVVRLVGVSTGSGNAVAQDESAATDAEPGPNTPPPTPPPAPAQALAGDTGTVIIGNFPSSAVRSIAMAAFAATALTIGLMLSRFDRTGS